MKRIFILLLLFSLGTTLIAQEDPKVLITDLIESGLLSRYHQYRKETMTRAADIKAIEADLSTGQLAEFQSVYRETSLVFERFIQNLRNDLLDAKARKYIRKHPDTYLETRLVELDMLYEEYYIGKFFPTYVTMTGNTELYRMGPPIAEPVSPNHPTVGATHKVLDYLDGSNPPQLKVFAQEMDRSWTVPNRFARWEEIGE